MLLHRLSGQTREGRSAPSPLGTKAWGAACLDPDPTHARLGFQA